MCERIKEKSKELHKGTIEAKVAKRYLLRTQISNLRLEKEKMWQNFIQVSRNYSQVWIVSVRR